jgi:Endomembrane protein 70
MRVLCMDIRRPAGGKARDQAVPHTHKPDPAAHTAAPLGQPPRGAVPGRRPAALRHHLRGAVLRHDLHLAGVGPVIVACKCSCQYVHHQNGLPHVNLVNPCLPGLTHLVLSLQILLLCAPSAVPACHLDPVHVTVLPLLRHNPGASNTLFKQPEQTSVNMSTCPQIFGFLFLVGILTTVITVEVSIVCTYVQLCAEDYLWWCASASPSRLLQHSFWKGLCICAVAHSGVGSATLNALNPQL